MFTNNIAYESEANIMPDIKYELDSAEDNVYLVYYPPHYTWEDYHRVIDSFIEITQGQKVHYINVYLPGAQIPASSPVPHQRRTVRVLNVGITIYVTSDNFLLLNMRTFHKLLNRIEGIHFCFAETIEEARQMMPTMIHELSEHESHLSS